MGEIDLWAHSRVVYPIKLVASKDHSVWRVTHS